MPASLSTTMVGPFIESCRQAYPQVTLKFIDGDSEFLREEVEKGRLDLALAFEDEFFPVVHRQPLFRQNHYLISSRRSALVHGPTISLEEVSRIPLILPGPLNARRIVIDRTFAKAGLSPNLAAEAVTVASELSAVRSAASTILNLGDMSGFSQEDFAKPLLIEPSFYLTCSLIWSNEFALTPAAEKVKNLLIDFLKEHIGRTKRPAAAWLA
jgi:LysR family nitrogen assimilation transcriptional regulator